MFSYKQTLVKNTKRVAPLLLAVCFSVSLVGPTFVSARTVNQQIRDSQLERQEAQDEADKLEKEASKVKKTISELKDEIAALQAQIRVNEKRRKSLLDNIKQQQQRLIQQRGFMAANIRSMYIESDTSLLEVMAASESLGVYIERQEYRDRLKVSITEAMEEIRQLTQQLNNQRREVDQIIADQETLRGELTEKRKEADEELEDINVNKDEFDKIVQEKEEELAQLLAQYAAVSGTRSAWTGGFITTEGTGGYKWAKAKLVEVNKNYSYSPVVDSWGLYARQCVSYVAWKLDHEGYKVKHFGGYGNANQWPATTQGGNPKSGINKAYTKIVTKPKAGDVAVQYIGEYGHVMYVEKVNSDQSIVISEYNFIPNAYSERKVPKSYYNDKDAGWTFLRFPKK